MPPKRTTNAQKRALPLKGKGTSITPKKKAETVEEVSTTQSHLKREDYQIIINWLRNKKNLNGEILPGQSGQSEVVNGDLFRPEEEHQQDCNDLGETWGLEEEEQQSDCLPSGDEILNPQSKSVPKDNVVQTASKDVNEDEPNDSPRKKSGSKRK
ncbi:hypothetical protein H4Q26_016954 [Puccinia striiformis f. sp. tritici PST-130]|nr:hypothetical protein Pst134EB_033179 [Puccinia striiformis f. sp. tritici]KAI9624247.1 hypothetical protein H4Q26_016954 [Puccinia striiformis f. sp. tritici PST-130]